MFSKVCLKVKPHYNNVLSDTKCFACNSWFDPDLLIAEVHINESDSFRFEFLCEQCIEAGPVAIRQHLKDHAESTYQQAMALHDHAHLLMDLAHGEIEMPTLTEWQSLAEEARASFWGTEAVEVCDE